MTALERLNEVKDLCSNKQYAEADKKICRIYDEYSSSTLWLSAEESHYMFLLLNKVSNALYS